MEFKDILNYFKNLNYKENYMKNYYLFDIEENLIEFIIW